MLKVTPITTWEKLRKRTLICASYVSEQPKAYMQWWQTLRTQPMETSMMRSFTMGQWWGTSSKILRTVKSQGASIHQGATRIKILNVPLICSGKLTHNSSDTSKNHWKCSTPRIPEVLNSPRYNKCSHWFWSQDAKKFKSTLDWPQSWNATQPM